MIAMEKIQIRFGLGELSESGFIGLMDERDLDLRYFLDSGY